MRVWFQSETAFIEVSLFPQEEMRMIKEYCIKDKHDREKRAESANSCRNNSLWDKSTMEEMKERWLLSLLCCLMSHPVFFSPVVNVCEVSDAKMRLCFTSWQTSVLIFPFSSDGKRNPSCLPPHVHPKPGKEKKPCKESKVGSRDFFFLASDPFFDLQFLCLSLHFTFFSWLPLFYDFFSAYLLYGVRKHSSVTVHFKCIVLLV